MDPLIFDLSTTPLREVNAALHAPDLEGAIAIENPAGAHSVSVVRLPASRSGAGSDPSGRTA